MTDPGGILQPGATLAAYRIERVLGQGGMGTVLQAYDTTLHRRVALKVLSAPSDSDTARAHLVREARSAASLGHPNICTVYEVGEASGCAFIAMEYVEGRSLRSRLDAGPLPQAEAVRCAIQAADALAYAHERGVVHRDFKAANVILTPDGRLKIVDFGLARRADASLVEATTMISVAGAGTVAGTPYAMAPEQVRGEAADARTDIWALGVFMYEMVAGARPFTGASVPEVFSSILRDPPARHPALTGAVQSVVERCLHKEPGARYQHALEIRAALDATLSADRPAPGARPRSRLVLAAAGATFIFFLAFLALAIRFDVAGLRTRLSGGSTAGAPTTLAVLPFVDLTNNPDQQTLADGLTRELIARFERFDSRTLRVVPADSSKQYTGRDRPIAKIAGELGADAVLSGTVSNAGDRLRMSVELLQASSNKPLWRESYDRASSDLFALQQELTAAVSDALHAGPPTRGSAASASAGARVVNPAAFDLYLRGLSHAMRINEPDIDRAIALLEQSAALDPTFLPAQAYLAFAYGQKSATFRPNEPAWEEKGFAAVQKALLLDPDAPEAHYAQALMIWRPSHGFPTKDALAELRKALAGRPNFDEAWHQYGVMLTHIGHLDDGLRAIERALQINPGHTTARFRIGPLRIYQLQFDEAIAALNRVPRETFPAQWTYQRAWALLSLGRLDEARALIDRSLVDNPGDQGGVLHSVRAMLRATSGDRRGAEADVAEAIRVGKSFIHFHHTAYAIGAVYTKLGDFDRAQQWIENAALDGFPNFTYFEADPHLAPLRNVPKFRTFLAQLRKEWETIPGIPD